MTFPSNVPTPEEAFSSTNLCLQDVDFRIVLKQLSVTDSGCVFTVREHQQRKLFTDLSSGKQFWTAWSCIPEMMEDETPEYAVQAAEENAISMLEQLGSPLSQQEQNSA